MSYVNNLRTFVRVYELGSMSAAGRDQRISAAVASARIAELERHLGVRLFNRTTRSLQPTEQGSIFYKGAQNILDTIAEAEAAVADVSKKPARLAARRRPPRHRQAPDRAADPRLQRPLPRDRRPPAPLRPQGRHHRRGARHGCSSSAPSRTSNLRVRPIADCPRLLAAAPAYLATHPHPRTGRDLIEQRHACLLHRYPGAREFVWTLSPPTARSASRSPARSSPTTATS